MVKRNLKKTKLALFSIGERQAIPYETAFKYTADKIHHNNFQFIADYQLRVYSILHLFLKQHNMGFLGLGSGGGLVIALIINVVALATPGWIYSDQCVDINGTECDFAQGLFDNATHNEIIPFERGDAEKVTISFQIMGDAVLIVAAICLCIGGLGKEKGVMSKVGGVLAFVGGIFIMIGVATYTAMYSDFVAEQNVSWGYSFALAWTSFCISILAAPLAFVDK